MAIQHGSHHRLVALQYLLNNRNMKLIRNISFDKNEIPLVPCSVNLIIDRNDLNQLKTVGDKPSQFSLEDLQVVRPLFDLIDYKSNMVNPHSTNQILEALESLAN